MMKAALNCPNSRIPTDRATKMETAKLVALDTPWSANIQPPLRRPPDAISGFNWGLRDSGPRQEQVFVGDTCTHNDPGDCLKTSKPVDVEEAVGHRHDNHCPGGKRQAS